MKLPSLPYNNLYVFLSVFGFIMIIYAIHLRDSFNSYVHSESAELAGEAGYLKFFEESGDTLTADYSSRKQRFLIKRKVYDKKQHQVEKEAKTISILSGCGTLFFALGIAFWYCQTQMYQDKLLKNEAKKLENDKSIYVHELQFKTEFEIYQDYWMMLAELKSITQKINALPQITTDAPKRAIESRSAKFSEHFNSFRDYVEKKKVFLPSSISEVTNELLKLIADESDDFVRYYTKSKQKKDRKESFDGIILKIEKIENLIQERIGLLKVKD